MLGKAISVPRTSFSQLSIFFDPENLNLAPIMGSIYSYRSLMLFRILKEAPAGFAFGIGFMQYLQSALALVGLGHSDCPTNEKSLQLVRDDNSITRDKLVGSYQLNSDEIKTQLHHESSVLSAMRKLGCYPISKMRGENGLSSHYAGSLPASSINEPGKTQADGRLWGFQNIYVGDASVFNYLPAKGLTFTIMANAHRVAQKVILSAKQ